MSTKNPKNQIIYIKFGELYLKGKNKNQFISCLYSNVKSILLKFKCDIIKFFDCFIVEKFNVKYAQEIIDLLKNVPGIALIIPAFIVARDHLQAAKTIALANKKDFKNFHSFRVVAKRIDKNYSTNSMDIAKQIGGVMLKSFANLVVDLHSAELTIYFELKNKYSIYYTQKIPGCGGFPLGINGRVLLLLSGGIDSPVAAKLLLKKGLHVDFVTFITPPHTSPKVLNKIKKLIKIISLDKKLYFPKLFVVNFTKLQHEIAHISNKSYQITLMRRYFFRIAEKLAQQNNYCAIATGESLGQVASQTIESLNTISQATPSLLILRPLISLDKNEIISLSKNYHLYETSILPYDDCCALFVPENPVTKPKFQTAEYLESQLTLINGILENTLKKDIILEQL